MYRNAQIVAAFGLMAVLFFSRTDAAEPHADSVSYRILPGIAQPKQRVMVYPPTPGMVSQLLVVEGQSVSENDMLAVLDDRVAQQSVDVARAAAEESGRVAAALAEITFARRQIERLESLERSKSVSLQEIESGKLTYNKARANVKTARYDEALADRRLELEETRLETLSIRAPFDGQVMRLQLTNGQKVQDNTLLMELVNISTLVVELYVPTALYDQLSIGETCQLYADVPVNRRIDAVLKTKEPFIDAGTQTFRCVFEIDNSDYEFPAGFVVRFEHLISDEVKSRLTGN